jgi:signal-transduction protein with cAMP-binding, CBS, and nucleotidyltransferase domain
MDIINKFLMLLQEVEPNRPLPEEFKLMMRSYMLPLPYCHKPTILEEEGCVPKYAYYVLRGFVLVYGYDAELNRYVRAIYNEHSFVALNCLMLQRRSEYTIVACADTLVWRISYSDMQLARRRCVDNDDIFWKASAAGMESGEALKNGLRSRSAQNRTLAFYSKFPCLLPPRKSIVKSPDIADYLMLSCDQLKRIRIALRHKQLLRYL